MRPLTFSLIALGLLLPAAFAEADELTTVLRASAEFGGEKLATVVYYDGYEDTTRAGDGLQLAIGVGLQHSPTWYSQATIGYRIGGTSGRNGDLELSSVPFEIMTFTQSPRWRAGLGVTWVSQLEMDSSGVLEGLDVSFKDATGFVGEVDWFFPQDDRFYFGLRATAIEYETERSGRLVNGDSFGFVFGMHL